jgi:hypothetical protein
MACHPGSIGLQGLKPLFFRSVNVAAKVEDPDLVGAAAHKDPLRVCFWKVLRKAE